MDGVDPGVIRVAVAAALLTVLPVIAHAAQQATGSVRGVVIDAGTGQPLAQARIALEGTDRESVTLDTGRFLLADAPAGPGELTVSLVGYGFVRRNIEIPAGGSLDLVIPLSEGAGTYTEEVRVTGTLFPREEAGVAGQMTIGSSELQNLRSLLADDPIRAVQALPGVGGTDDFRSDFSIRASDFRHVGVTLDGVPSPLLVHTVRNADDTGSLAMINTDTLEGVALLAGSYPQRYGNRTGGQVDFHSREGSRDRTQVRGALSAINASLVAEGPIGGGRRGSWLISARKSYLDWLVREIDPEVTGTFGFVDAQAKAVYDLTPRNTLTFNLVAGRSRYDERDPSPGVNGLELGFNRAMLASLSLRSTLTPTTLLTQRGYFVVNRFGNYNATALPLQRGREHDLSYRADVTARGPLGSVVEAGGHLQQVRATGDESEYDATGRRRGEFRFVETTTRQGAYGMLRVRLGPFVSITPGVRVDRWVWTGETLASPWLQVETALPGRLLLAGGTGIYRQAPEVFQVAGPRGSRTLEAERAHHADLGVGQQVGAYRWQISGFVRDESQVITRPGTEPRLFGTIFFPGTDATSYQNRLDGRARGIEMMIQRRSANGLSGWIGYALVNGRTEDEFLRDAYVSDAEQRHVLNTYAHYRISTRLSVSGRLRAATNTPLEGYYVERDGRLYVGDARNLVRLPRYARLDLRANRTFDVGGNRLTLFVEVLNVFNRRNLRGQEDPDIDRRTLEVRNATQKLFPVVPSAGVLLEF